MLGLGWTELMVIGVVGLIVIGPKDLPDMFRTLGRFTAKARRMAGEFQRAMESAADDTGMKDVAKDLKTMTSARSMGLEAVKGAASKFEAWDPMKPHARATPATAPPIAAATPPVVNAGDAVGPLPNAMAVNDAAGASVQPVPTAFGPAAQAPVDAQVPQHVGRSDASAVEGGVGSPGDVTAAMPAIKTPGRRRAAVALADVVPIALPEIVEKKPRAPRKAAIKAEAP